MLDKVLQIWRQGNLKLNKDKCLFRCNNIPFFGEVISWHSVSPDPCNVQAFAEILPPESNKRAAIIFGISNYLSKFPPVNTEVCKPL